MPEDILSYLKMGPRTARELIDGVSISRKTFYKRINDLLKEGRILEFPIRQRKGWVSLYALPKHYELAASISRFLPIGGTTGIEQSIKEAIENLKLRLLRNPTVGEVILEISANPEDPKLRDAVYQIGTRMGWKPPTKREREIAEKELPEILSLAAQLKRGSSRLTKVKSTDKIEKAKEYLKRFPNLVPER
jgi:DNA-binding Lrp family transcriptional regulator